MKYAQSRFLCCSVGNNSPDVLCLKAFRFKPLVNFLKKPIVVVTDYIGTARPCSLSIFCHDLVIVFDFYASLLYSGQSEVSISLAVPDDVCLNLSVS